jgi:4-diphosphocytidyl-2-C-methyl-D-erythritol kinase
MGVSLFSPAKINLYLAVTGRRADGFHDLVSVVAPLDFGDQLVVEARERRTEDGGQQFGLTCDDPTVPVDGTNLVLKAAAAFAAATGWPVRQDQGGPGGVDFQLTKRIPLGAGLGGGSSNAVAALRALNQLAGGMLGEARVAEIAATLGSDCALFLKNAPVVMRGRGERVDPLPPAGTARIRGRRVLLFKPGFGISTPWAYGRMAASAPAHYCPAAEAEARLAAWLGGDEPVEKLLANNLEGVAFEKFIALPVLLARLQREFGVTTRMSGSGSACYALLPDDFAPAPLIAAIRAAWGPGCFVQEARLA